MCLCHEIFFLINICQFVFMPWNHLFSQKPSSTVAERSFAIGTIAETLMACGQDANIFAPHLYPIFMSHTHDSDSEVRSNAIFGLGVLVSMGVEQETIAAYPCVDLSVQLWSFGSNVGEFNKRWADGICWQHVNNNIIKVQISKHVQWTTMDMLVNYWCKHVSKSFGNF